MIHCLLIVSDFCREIIDEFNFCSFKESEKFPGMRVNCGAALIRNNGRLCFVLFGNIFQWNENQEKLNYMQYVKYIDFA